VFGARPVWTEPAALAGGRNDVRLVALICVLAAMAVTCAIARAHAADRSRTVPCSESIDGTRFPYVGSNDPGRRYRFVLGAVSAPPAYLEQTSPTGERRWRYFSKAGLVIRAGREGPVLVSVPHGWRDRAAIAWGYGGHGVFSSLRIAGCGRVRVTRTRAASSCARERPACRSSSASAAGVPLCASASVVVARSGRKITAL